METDKSSVSPGTLLTVEIDTVPPAKGSHPGREGGNNYNQV